MPEPAIGLRLDVAFEPDADAAELVHATSRLREELLERADRATEPAPPGSRGVDATARGTLIVGAGRGAIGPVLTAVHSWVARRSSPSVRITIDGDSPELANDKRRPVESSLDRHSP